MTERFRAIPEQANFTSRPSGTERKPFTAEELHTSVQEISKHFRPIGEKGRPSLQDRVAERMKQMEDIAQVRAKIDDDINRHREKIEQEAQERGGNVTGGQLFLLLLGAILATPAILAEQASEDAKKQAEQAV